ncbi:DNA topoisomerase IB large subunit [Leptomonas pyrrhocoris]|uniref:DNA topoisomerase I n=1 Tax=Leptomonas pyrrhocoris TaxID=157538 RepID=A0A0M9G5A8_LEPPY|nr:DNA topoisomerase IB large subunit [Leptomonas pyrrhocoris]KPA82439.1 DNA topoisomerase IB large subunit [Leptomonas pyrrhocoris]|eukprot:XP_015660878.1 DNA topoisomerase IB large subunit [Leptomonas pyrrhocoris]
MKTEEKKSTIKREETRSDEDEENNEEELNWWEQENLRIAAKGERRWETLSHNGVLFPPLYVPHGIPIYYEGKEFKMTTEEEEVATMFASMKEHDYYRMDAFRRNFFESWREILDKREHPIRRLELCDFEPIYQWYLREREKKQTRTREEKKAIKQQQDAEAEPYRYCVWDGRQEQVANFRVEPPGLFRGRGKHPLMGKLKVRVQAEDITINIGETAEVPPAPPGHHWAAVQHDHTVTWLAMWRDSVAGNFKYVMLAPSSSVKGQSDMAKFEKARRLKSKVDDIRASYMQDFKSNDTHVAQRAVAMYFIDRLALRVGNEKSEDEADTVGCCSLRVEHIQLLPDNVVRFDFLGKDSIRYQNDVTVLPEVYALLQRFTRRKSPAMDIFDQLTPTQLNDHLKSFMDGLSAKVFRTYNASITLDKWFKEKPVNPRSSVADKLAYFNKANTEVAILCNHQKTVSKNFKTQMAQLTVKSEHTRRTMELLEKALATAKKLSLEAAAAEFLAEEDRVQRAWLESYGTEEQKKEFEEIVVKRSALRAPSSKKKSSSTGTKKARSSASNGKTAKKSKSAKKAKSAKKSKKPTTTRGKKASGKKKNAAAAEDSDDEPLMNLAVKKETTKKAGVKRQRAVKAEDSDDDDVPLAALSA